MSYFRAYTIGLCCASVCTDLPQSDVADEMNRRHPTGISSSWTVSLDATFAGGEPHPFPCPDDPSRRHYLLEC